MSDYRETLEQFCEDYAIGYGNLSIVADAIREALAEVERLKETSYLIDCRALRIVQAMAIECRHYDKSGSAVCKEIKRRLEEE
jgi:hypothetical protein